MSGTLTTLERLAHSEAQAHARFGAFGRLAYFGPLVAVALDAESPLSAAWLDGGLPSEADWNAWEVFCAEQGVPLTLKLLSNMALALLPSLAQRGYGLTTLLHAYACDPRALPPGSASAQSLNIRDEPDAFAWAALAAQGFGQTAAPVMAVVGQAAGTRRFVATVGGEVAGTAALSVVAGVAALHGTAVRPGYRRQGVQAALLAWRLREAARAGADLASVFVTPGSGSERNVRRAGFELVGARLDFGRVSVNP